MNLFDELKKINRRYYYEETISVEEDFTTTKNKIKIYFENASKENLSIDFDELDELREQHSMSLVYLGILLNEKLKLDIKIKEKGISFPFNYVWNILCLYHDLGYIFENNKSYIYKVRNRNLINQIGGYNNKWNMINSKICFDGYFNYSYNRRFSNSYNQIFRNHSKNIENSISTENELNCIKNISDLRVCYFAKERVIDKSHFLKSTIEKYYKYRLEEMGKYDHGILGGFMLFNNLVKNYITKMQGEQNKTYFIKDSKIFRIEQITLFSYIADCIVAHNIFFPSLDDIHLYEEYGLNELISFNIPIKIRDNPLLFLLYLVDSIDPIKYFKQKTNLNSEEILKSISVSFANKSFELSKTTNSIIDDDLFINYLEKINNIKTWLGVHPSINTNSIKVEILE